MSDEFKDLYRQKNNYYTEKKIYSAYDYQKVDNSKMCNGEKEIVKQVGFLIQISWFLIHTL